jgi:hypothetical protein
MSLDRTELEDRKARTRSRVTNGSAFLPSGDGRSIWVRLARDTYFALVAHLWGSTADCSSTSLGAELVERQRL